MRARSLTARPAMRRQPEARRQDQEALLQARPALQELPRRVQAAGRSRAWPSDRRGYGRGRYVLAARRAARRRSKAAPSGLAAAAILRAVMATCLVTGGAGFLGSHLCDELLRRGHRVICVDNFETGSLAQHRAHPRAGVRAPARATSSSRTSSTSRSTSSTTSPRPASPIDYLRLPLHTLKVGSLRHAPHARPGQAAPRALPARLDERGLRRPAGPPAARDLLGPREPDRPARRLRRGQALRRGADDGLPPPAGRGHRDRADLQHLRPADAPARRPRDPDVPAPGAAGPADHGVRRRQPDALVLLRRRPRSTGIIRLAESGEHHPVNIGNPNEFTLLELAEAVIEVTGSRSEIVYEALPTDDPQVRQPDITLRPRAARLGADGRAARGPAAHARASPASRRSSGARRLMHAACATPRHLSSCRVEAAERATWRTRPTADRRAVARRRAASPLRRGAVAAPRRRPPQAPAGALVPAADGDAAPRRARRARCWRSTSPALFAAIFTALMVKAVLRDGDCGPGTRPATRRSDTIAFAYLRDRAAVRALRPLRRPRRSGPGLPRIVSSLFQVTVVALIFALVNGEQYSSYYIFYGTLIFAIVYRRRRCAGPTSRSPARCCAPPATAAARCSSARGEHIEDVAHALDATRCTRRSRWSASSRSRRGPTTACARSGGSRTSPQVLDAPPRPGGDHRRPGLPAGAGGRARRRMPPARRDACAIAPSTMEILVHRAEFVPGASVPLFELRPPVFDGFDYVVKRTFDFVVSRCCC